MLQILLAIPATGDYRKWAEVTAASVPYPVVFLDWTNCDRAKLERLGDWHGSAIAWSRLFLSEILPADVEWVISCDADVLFRGDATKLMDVVNGRGEGENVKNRPIVWMSADSQPPWRKHHPDVAKWLAAHPEVDAGEILCSGLTVINVKRWREEGWQAKVDAFIAKYPDVPFLDQMALNVVFKDAKAKLPRQWGCFSGDTNDDVDYNDDCAIHYVGDAPWERKGLTRLMSDAVVLWRQAAGLSTGGWRRWLWCALQATAPLWRWEPHLAWHFRTALKSGVGSRESEVGSRCVNGMEVVRKMLEEKGVPKADEVWVHGMWLPRYWRACLGAKLRGKKLVRMTHGSLDPVRLNYSGWKKRLVSPIEWLCFALADRVVTTGPWETAWCRAWGVKGEIEEIDLRGFFELSRVEGERRGGEKRWTKEGSLHVLYLGRRHPLKGVDYLERAVEGISIQRDKNVASPLLRIVSDHFGAELEADWAWCDVLCLPTLSENFGLVVAEALARGKRVITTDGAPAWGGSDYGGRLQYLRGYRDGTESERVALLTKALDGLRRSAGMV